MSTEVSADIGLVAGQGEHGLLFFNLGMASSHASIKGSEEEGSSGESEKPNDFPMVGLDIRFSETLGTRSKGL
jgi:hypothetical protein